MTTAVALGPRSRNLRICEGDMSLSIPGGGVTTPNYHLVVKKSAGLETTRVKLDGLKTYTSNQGVLEYISLMFSNWGLYKWGPNSELLGRTEWGRDCPKKEPGGTVIPLKVHPSLAGVGGDRETPRKSPVSKMMVSEMHLAAVSVTKTTKLSTMTADTLENVNAKATLTAEDAITATEFTATTNAPKDVASHDDDALHTQHLQPACQLRDYSTQNYDDAGTYTGAFPRTVRGGLKGSNLTVTNTRERETSHELRAGVGTTTRGAGRDLGHKIMILVTSRRARMLISNQDSCKTEATSSSSSCCTI